jgi:hypothetical protein
MQELSIHIHFSPQFYEALERLAVSQHSTAEILKNTHSIIRRLQKMPTEQQLDDAISNVRTAVSAAADRVIAKLQAHDIDLSDEISDLEALKTSVDAIAPDEAPTPEPAP